jgi:hypothetical protein
LSKSAQRIKSYIVIHVSEGVYHFVTGLYSNE